MGKLTDVLKAAGAKIGITIGGQSPHIEPGTAAATLLKSLRDASTSGEMLSSVGGNVGIINLNSDGKQTRRDRQ